MDYLNFKHTVNGNIEFSFGRIGIPFEKRFEEIERTLEMLKQLHGKPLMFAGVQIGKCIFTKLEVNPDSSYQTISFICELDDQLDYTKELFGFSRIWSKEK